MARKLDVRHCEGNNPTRIIIDRQLKIPKSSNVLDGNVSTIILTAITDKEKFNTNCQYKIIDFENEVAQNILEALYKENLTSVIIEGGAATLQTFINANLWDEVRVFIGTSKFDKGIKAPSFKGNEISSKQIGQDQLKIFRP